MIGLGDLKIEVPNGMFPTSIILKDVFHAPNMGLTIVSINRITKAGYTVEFKDEFCVIRDKAGDRVGSIPANQNGLYKVESIYAATPPEERADLAMLHRRLAHISPDSIQKLISSGAIEGIKLIDDESPLICDACEQAKATHKPIRKEREALLVKSFGAEIHSDLWGPSPIPSLGGRKYYATFTNNHSCYTQLAPLKTKDETLDAYKSFASWASTQHSAKIKRLRSDRGGKYMGRAFTDFLRQQGTKRRLTTHDTPQHNGVMESLNRRLMERV